MKTPRDFRLRGGRGLAVREILLRPPTKAALLRAVALDPAQPDAHYQLGLLYQALGKPAEAEKELHKVQELHKKAEDSLLGEMPSSSNALNCTETK